jgi:hypothetical protein
MAGSASGAEFMGAALDALGAGDHGRRPDKMRRQRGDGCAQMLRRRCDQDHVGSRGNGEIAGDADVCVQRYAGQFRIGAGGGDLRRVFGATRIKHDIAPRARRDAGQRRSPRTGADHRDRSE